MRIAYTDLSLKLDIKRGEMKILQLENPVFATEFVNDILRQIKGEEGKILFTDEDQVITLSKEAELIFNPFDTDLSAHKIQTKLLKEAREIADDYGMEEMADVRRTIISFMDELEKHLPYPTTYSDEFDITALLKMLSLSIDDEGEGFPDSLVSYIKILQRLCGINVFIFVNLLQFLSTKQIEFLEREICNLDVFVLNIETKAEHAIKNVCVVDSGLCVIE